MFFNHWFIFYPWLPSLPKTDQLYLPAIRRIEREERICRKLNHINIVQLHNVYTERETRWLPHFLSLNFCKYLHPILNTDCTLHCKPNISFRVHTACSLCKVKLSSSPMQAVIPWYPFVIELFQVIPIVLTNFCRNCIDKSVIHSTRYLIFDLVTGGELFEEICNRKYFSEADARLVENCNNFNSDGTCVLSVILIS